MKKYRTLKRVFGVSLIILGLVIGLVPNFTKAATTDSGVDGSIQWEIKDKVLTLSAVSGSDGKMKDYTLLGAGNTMVANTPWTQSALFPNVEEIVVKDGVTSIGEYGLATYNDTTKYIKKLTLAGTIKTYNNHDGWYARYEEIVFEEGFESISDEGVFWTGTKILRFPSTVTSIPTKNFAEEGDGPVFDLTDVYGYSNTVAKTFTDNVNTFLATNDPTKSVTFHALDTTTTPTLTVKDSRTTKTNTGSIAATVTNLTKDSTFIVKDSTSTALQKLLTLKTGMKLVTYDLSLVDSDGNAITDFGTCKVTLPLPSGFDTKNGTVTVEAVGTDGKLENLVGTFATSNSVTTVTFNATHFSEYGLLYTPSSSSTSDNNNSNNNNNNTNNNNTNGTTTNTTTPTVIVVPTQTTTATTTPAANTTASGQTTNAKDMPKTGPGDELRTILAIFICLIGAAIFINSLFAKEK